MTDIEQKKAWAFKMAELEGDLDCTVGIVREPDKRILYRLETRIVDLEAQMRKLLEQQNALLDRLGASVPQVPQAAAA